MLYSSVKFMGKSCISLWNYKICYLFGVNILSCNFIHSDRRLADHFGGKLHLGYMQIREKLEELQVRSLSFILILWNLLLF